MGRASPFHEADGDYRTEKFMETNGASSSVLPLYLLQTSLPRLPVPTLEETFARYLVSVQPLAEPTQQYPKTAAAVREFLREGGLVRAALRVDAASLCLNHGAVVVSKEL